MGLIIFEIEYPEQIPSFPEIREEFQKLTGLYLRLIADLKITDLVSDPEKLLQEFQKQEVAKVIDVSLYVDHFYEIKFQIEKQKITIEYYAGQYYFPEALIEVLCRLKGEKRERRGIDLSLNPNYRRPLKKWEAYKWYNRVKK